MIQNAQNKSIGDEPVKKEEGATQEFHFPGHPDYYPLTIIAHSQSEAHRLWIQKRVPVNPGKVEQNKEL